MSDQPKVILEPLVYPEPERRLSSGRFLDILAFMGPGMILASATIGNGEIFAASRGGAVFGYAIAWTFFFGAIMKGFVVYSGARYITLTGEHPFARWGHIFPGPKGRGKHWLALFLGGLAIFCFPAWASAFMVALGQWTRWTFGLDASMGLLGVPTTWAIVWGIVAWITLFVAGYERVEKFQTGVVVLKVVFALIAVAVSGANWALVAKGFIPTVPGNYPDWIVQNFPDVAARPVPLEIIAYLGALGGGTYDYIGYLGTFREKKWGMLGRPDIDDVRAQLQQLSKTEGMPLDMSSDNMARARTWLKAPTIDTFTSFMCVTIFALTFMVLGAVILGTDGVQQVPTDSNILEHQAAFFTGISPVLKYFYQLAIWAAFFGALQGLTYDGVPHTVRESFAPAFPSLNQESNWHKLQIAVASYAIFGGILLIVTGVTYINAITFAGVLGGVFSLGIWGFAQLATERRMLPPELRMKKPAEIAVLISSAALFIMGLVALLQLFGVKF